jgi:NRAMP (natural resistance-associated macrophage protein)-like metal ion transporter
MESGSEKKSPPGSFWRRASTFLRVLGPGLITANVDNDAGGIATYSQAGARFGFRLLWSFLPVTFLLILVQEMVNRMGVVTGQGLSDLIRERFGVRVTFYVMLLVIGTNFGNVMGEFAGIASAAPIFGVPGWQAVPVCAVLVWLLVLKGSYGIVEKVFLVACLLYLAYPLTLAIIRPDLREVGRALVTPTLSVDRDYLVMLIGLVGTTIAPWMQFYQQASVAEKNIHLDDYGLSRLDTIVGGIVVSLVAGSIVVACARTIHVAGLHIEEASDAARALAPLAGKHSSILFALGLWNASLFAASVLPLSTSYAFCEAMGWESGLDKSYAAARQFYVLYTLMIALPALMVLLPGLSLLKVMFWSQVLNGLLLPVVLVVILILIRDRRLMRDWANGALLNLIGWAAVVLLTIIDVGYLVTLFLG